MQGMRAVEMRNFFVVNFFLLYRSLLAFSCLFQNKVRAFPIIHKAEHFSYQKADSVRFLIKKKGLAIES
jgi:hypothetical protein